MTSIRSHSARAIGSADHAPAPSRVALSAVLTLGALAVFGVAGYLVPLLVFFAVGAGAGYSLSGSV